MFEGYSIWDYAIFGVIIAGIASAIAGVFHFVTWFTEHRIPQREARRWHHHPVGTVIDKHHEDAHWRPVIQYNSTLKMATTTVRRVPESFSLLVESDKTFPENTSRQENAKQTRWIDVSRSTYKQHAIGDHVSFE